MISIWKYESYFNTGLWHVHTHYTDGKHSVDEICSRANALGFPLVCFAEHVRRSPDYDVEAFLAEVNAAAQKWPDMIILSGLEAKLLPDGIPDCRENLMEKVDVLFLAEHGFGGDYSAWFAAMELALGVPQVQVWAHPLLLPFKKGWTVDFHHLERLCHVCRENGVLVEINRRYVRLHTEEVFKDYYPKLNGFDLHDLRDLSEFDPYSSSMRWE